MCGAYHVSLLYCLKSYLDEGFLCIVYLLLVNNSVDLLLRLSNSPLIGLLIASYQRPFSEF